MIVLKSSLFRYSLLVRFRYNFRVNQHALFSWLSKIKYRPDIFKIITARSALNLKSVE